MAGIKLKRRAAWVPVLLITGAAILTGAASSVFAGFEWKGMPAVTSSPAPAATDEIKWGGDGYGQAPTPAKMRKELAVEAAPVAPLLPPPLPSAEKTSGSPEGATVEGFGTDLPLNLALQQVVPPDYQVSFADGVSPDAGVSWTGGKSWKEVLADMLSPHDLDFRLQDKTVIVSHLIRAQQAAPGASSETAPVSLAPSSAEKTGKADTMPVDMVAAVKEMNVGPVPAAVPVAEAAPAPIPLTAGHPAPAAQPRAKAAPPSPAMMPYAWRADAGQTLKEILTDWSGKAGVKLYWTIDYDYRLNQTAVFEGSFDKVTAELLNLFGKTRPQPYGRLYRDKIHGGGVLSVSSYDLPD